MQKKKHHNHQNYKCKIPGKKGNKYQVSFPKFMKHHSKKKQTNFPLKSSEILTLMHMFLNRASRLPLCVIVPAPRPWIDCIHDEESVDISLASRCLQWYFDIDNVNISALEFHHCHHVFVGYYLEYSWIFMSIPFFLYFQQRWTWDTDGRSTFPSNLKPSPMHRVFAHSHVWIYFFLKNNPETMVNQGIKCSFPLLYNILIMPMFLSISRNNALFRIP